VTLFGVPFGRPLGLPDVPGWNGVPRVMGLLSRCSLWGAMRVTDECPVSGARGAWVRVSLQYARLYARENQSGA
jgi:hypothetical protein